MTDWRPYFPLQRVRPEQERALDFITQAFVDGTEYVVAELGTGVGKSAIAVTVAKWMRAWHMERGCYESELPQAYVVTSQKVLQDQYLNDFSGTVVDLRSSSNFKCVGMSSQSCGETSRLRKVLEGKPCMDIITCEDTERGCPYRSAKECFKRAVVGVTNYSYLLSEAVYAGRLKPRELIVFDECVRGNTLIWIDNDHERKMRDVYENHAITHVMSFNETTNSYERKRIVRRMRTSYTADTKWIRIQLDVAGQRTLLEVTDNHKVWTKNRGYVRADELTTDDVLKFDTLPKQNLTYKDDRRKSGVTSGHVRKGMSRVVCHNCDKTFTSSGMLRHQSLIIELRPCAGEACRNLIEITKSSGPNKRFCGQTCYHQSLEFRTRTSQRMLTNNPMKSADAVTKMKATWHYNWDNVRSEESKQAQLTRFKNAPLHENRTAPNSLEQFIIDMNLPHVRFTGLGEKWVTFKNGKHKNPDFVIEHTNRVIEIGDVHYWHSIDEIKDVKKRYAEIGYECLYVTNVDLADHFDDTITAIRKFVCNHNVTITKITHLQKSSQFNNDVKHFKYNIEVEDNHNYFANSVLVSNCHNIESEVRKWATVTATQKFVKLETKLTLPTKEKDVAAWFEKYAHALGKLLAKSTKDVEKEMAPGKLLSPKLRDLTRRHEFLDKHLCQVNRYVMEKGSDRSNYLVTFEGSGDEASVQLRPLDVGGEAQQLLYSKGRHRLLMSATVLDNDTFDRSVGLPKSGKVKHISIPTPFEPTAFGLTFRPVGRMTSKQSQTTMPRLIKEIRSILDKHPDHKGVIHTSTYDVTKAIGMISNDRLLVQTCADDREKILHEHLTSPRPTVLVSPAMGEGLDLRGDLGRFSVLCKVPYPYLGDEVVKEKSRRDRAWYAWCTVRAIVQAVGRCVRSQDDWAVTYILDESFWDLMSRNPSLFPSYFGEMKVEEPCA